MGNKKKLINKTHKKKADRRCYFCKNEEYCTLDVHRIIPGCKGGRYDAFNSITTCSNCHRKIHDGKIRIDRKYPSTNGWVLHYFSEDGQEHWD